MDVMRWSLVSAIYARGTSDKVSVITRGSEHNIPPKKIALTVTLINRILRRECAFQQRGYRCYYSLPVIKGQA